MIKGLRRSLRGERNVSSSTTGSHHSIAQKSPLTILPPKKVIKALYDYNASAPGELSFNKGDFFHVIGNENDLNWYEACNPSTNMRGMVPVTYFQILGRNERESAGSSIETRKKNSGISESSSSPAAHSPTNRRSSGVISSASSTSSGKNKGQPLYGIVQYNFAAERPDELDAYEGDTVIVVAQSNHEWFVAKPIGRLGGPGLIPISYVEIRDMTTGKTIENVEEAIHKAGVPHVEEWKKRTADYKASSIPLGKFEDDVDVPYSKFQSLSLTQQQQQQQQYQLQLQQQQLQQKQQHASMSQSQLYLQQQHQSIAGQSYNGTQISDRLSQRTSGSAYDAAVISASVERFSFDSGRYWYLLVAEMDDGTFRNLCRFYEDFYDFQIRLLDEYPDEAGRTGRQRILPFIPGPVTFVNDSISSQRRANLDEYVHKLVMLPPYISRSPLVRGLFALRPDDVESHQPVMPLPRPQFRDSRGTATSGQSSSQLSQKTDTILPYSAEQSGSRNLRLGQQASSDKLQSAVSGQPGNSHLSARTSSASLSTTISKDARVSFVGGDSEPGDAETEPGVEQSAYQSQGRQQKPSSAGYLKVKVFYREDLIAIRVPSDIDFLTLENKLHERLGSSNLVFYYQDEHTGQHYELASDAELTAAVGSSTKLVLYTQ